jgi:hypothetical protein
MQKKIYTVLLISFAFILIFITYKSEIQNLGEIRVKYLKYYFVFGSWFLIFLIGFYFNHKIRFLILISTFTIIFTTYFIESYILFKSYKSIKIKEVSYMKNSSKVFDKRSSFQYFEDIRKKNNEIKVAVYPDSFNKLKNIDIFPLSGISNKETILCNENGYYIHYFSDRYGFNNLDSEWDKEKIEYLLLGDSLVHGFCVEQKNNITNVLKKISKKNVMNLSYGGNGPLIQLASLREFKPNNVKKIIWTYSEWNDLIDLSFEINHPILLQYYLNKDFSQNLKKKQDIIDNIGNISMIDSYKKSQSRIKDQIKNFIFLNNLRFIISKKTKFFIPEQNFQIFEKIIIQFIEFSLENNSQPYFVYIPSYNTFLDKINEINYLRIKNIIEKLDISFIDIRNEIVLNNINIKELFPYELPGHFSEKGYKFIGKKIYENIN